MNDVTISTYMQDTRTASVYARTYGGYRVILIDAYFETQDEKYFETLKESEDFAEDWVLKC